MTDTVNKQRLLEWLESELKNKDYESHVLDTLTTTYLRIKSGKFDSPPTTPVQGYREALERVRKINKLPYWSDRAMELEFWQGELESQALSQTDIQPSGWIPVSMEPVPDDGLYIVTDGSTSTYGHWSAGIGTITYWMPLPQPPGINSTEDDQRGPSISSTRFMLDGQLCGVCNEGVPLDHAQIGRLEADGTHTPYHMGCEGAANKLEPCTDCGHHRKFCSECAEPSTEEEETE